MLRVKRWAAKCDSKEQFLHVKCVRDLVFRIFAAYMAIFLNLRAYKHCILYATARRFMSLLLTLYHEHLQHRQKTDRNSRAV